jgi:hypothetical protein
MILLFFEAQCFQLSFISILLSSFLFWPSWPTLTWLESSWHVLVKSRIVEWFSHFFLSTSTSAFISSHFCFKSNFVGSKRFVMLKSKWLEVFVQSPWIANEPHRLLKKVKDMHDHLGWSHVGLLPWLFEGHQFHYQL